MAESWPCPRCTTVATRASNLRTHLMGRNAPGHRMTDEEAAAVLARGPRLSPAPTDSAVPTTARQSLRMPPLTIGHTRSLRLLEQTEALHRTAAEYQRLLGHSVYFRPTSAGLTVLSLDLEAPAMTGVGTLTQLLPPAMTVRRQIADYQQKLAGMVRASPEERTSVAWIAAALHDGLQLPVRDLRFVCQEWRLPLEPSGSAKLDLLAVDLRTSRLVVIELKSTVDSPGRQGTPAEQADRYARWLHDGREYFSPFFQRLCHAMANAYPGPARMRTLVLDDRRAPDALVALAERG